MADGIVQVAPDSTGKKIDASELTVGANTVERQRINLADPATAAAIAAILNANPASGDYGLVTRLVNALSNPLFVKLTDGTNVLTLETTAADSDPTSDLAVPAECYNLVFNGTTWDRLRGSVANGAYFDKRAVNGVTRTVGEGASDTGTERVTLAQMGTTSANLNATNGTFSLGNSTGKTNAFNTGNLATTAVTADQVITTRTVTAGKTLYIETIAVSVRLTTFATTATWFGAFSLETPSGTKVITLDASGAGAMAPVVITFPEPIPVAAGVVARLVCTPGATTGYTWKGAIMGYEK